MALPIVNKIANEQDHKTRLMELMAERTLQSIRILLKNNFLPVVDINST
jgi:hypothetical protein